MTASTQRPTVERDTVDRAAATPEREQPFAALGLKPDEYARIREILGRRLRDRPPPERAGASRHGAVRRR